MAKVESMECPPVAFAIGGLGGNNAFGAGFLQAALDKRVKPAMITCTSGQIWWVSKYVNVIDQKTAPTECLRKELEKFIESTEPFHQHDADLIYMGLLGKPGMMRTAFPEFILDIIKNTISAFERFLRQDTKMFLLRELMREWPGRVLIPCFPEKFFDDISETFKNSSIGIAFNSYDPIEGMEVVHLNPKAKELLNKQPGDRDEYPEYRTRTLYKDINKEYVKNGLWLTQYGFDDSSIFDGCYFRGVMLSEAAIAKTIFVSRPINKQWIGTLPTSYIETEDMKTEIFFNGSYQAERDKIQLVNKFLEKGIIPKEGISTKEGARKKYHAIDLHEVEIETQRGFFDYVLENINVFDQARKLAGAEFDLYNSTSRRNSGATADVAQSEL